MGIEFSEGKVAYRTQVEKPSEEISLSSFPYSRYISFFGQERKKYEIINAKLRFRMRLVSFFPPPLLPVKSSCPSLMPGGPAGTNRAQLERSTNLHFRRKPTKFSPVRKRTQRIRLSGPFRRIQ